jgi:ubiquitin-protein ligase
MEKPNPYDPLAVEIGKEYINDFRSFKKKAVEYTEKYA